MALKSWMFLCLIIGVSTGEPEIAPAVPVQHQELHIKNVLRQAGDKQAGSSTGHQPEYGDSVDKEGVVKSMAKDQRKHTDIQDEKSDDAHQLVDWGKALVQDVKAPAKKHLGSARNLKHHTWTYESQQERNRRSVPYGLTSLETYPFSDYNSHVQPPQHYGNGYRESEKKRGLFSRYSSKRRGNPKQRGPVMHRWQSIWGSPGKREFLGDIIQKDPRTIGQSIDWTK